MAYLTTRNNYRTPVTSPFDSLFSNMLGDWGLSPSKVPPVDITETDKAYILEAELPGYTQEDVKVNIEKHVLRISSAKQTTKEEKDGKKLLICERHAQSFERAFSLPRMWKSPESKGLLPMECLLSPFRKRKWYSQRALR